MLFGELVLTDEDGQPWPAGELLVPGAALATVLAADADRPVVGREWTDRYPTDVLVAAGVRAGFAVVSVSDRNRDQVELPDLDEWLESAPIESTEAFTALADLDLVDPDRWPAALALIAADREARACLAPSAKRSELFGLVALPQRRARRPTARASGACRRPTTCRVCTTRCRQSWTPSSPVRSGSGWICPGAAADDPEALLDRLADPTRRVSPANVAAVTAAVVAALAGVEGVDLPSGVRTLSGDVVDAGDACVLDEPWLAQLLPAARLVPGGADPALVARVLDLPLASDLITGAAIAEAGAARPDRRRPLGRLDEAAAAMGLRLADHQITVAPELAVALDGAEPVPVRWWFQGGRWWVDGSPDAAGRAVAWAAGAWPDRYRAIAAAAEDCAGAGRRLGLLKLRSDRLVERHLVGGAPAQPGGPSLQGIDGQPQQAEDEPGQAGPQPDHGVIRLQVRDEEQQHDEGDEPDHRAGDGDVPEPGGHRRQRGRRVSRSAR